MSRAFRLGITGKIGSGKSTLSEVARRNGIKVLEADTIAKEVMTMNPEVRFRIESVFGSESYENGNLNRPYLAARIFTDDELRIRLEEIVHPATLEVYENEFKKSGSGSVIALESAILFQTGLDDLFDAVILIDAKDEDVISRLLAKGRFSSQDIRNRLSQQAYLNEWKEDADFVIVNNGSESDFLRRCESLIQIIMIIANQSLPEESLRSIIE